MGNIVVLFCVVNNVIITSRFDDEVGNGAFTPADGATANDAHAITFTTLESEIISHQKSLRQKLSIQQKLLNNGEHSEKENANIKLLDAAFLTHFRPVIKSIFIGAVIVHTFTSTLASDNILQISLHQKIKEKLHEDEYYNVKENENILQLAAANLNSHLHLILVAITAVHFAAGSVLQPTLSFPAPYGIPDGYIVLGGGPGVGAVVIRGGLQLLNLSPEFDYSFIHLLPVYCCNSEIQTLFVHLNFFQNMLCVMVIDNDCYAYRGVNKLFRLLSILFILRTMIIYFISIVCSVVLLVYTYFIND
eukprot:UN00285